MEIQGISSGDSSIAQCIVPRSLSFIGVRYGWSPVSSCELGWKDTQSCFSPKIALQSDRRLSWACTRALTQSHRHVYGDCEVRWPGRNMEYAIGALCP